MEGLGLLGDAVGSLLSRRLLGVQKDLSQNSNVFFSVRMFSDRLVSEMRGPVVVVVESISFSRGGTRKARSRRKFTLAERVDIARTGRPPENGLLVTSEWTSYSFVVKLSWEDRYQGTGINTPERRLPAGPRNFQKLCGPFQQHQTGSRIRGRISR